MRNFLLFGLLIVISCSSSDDNEVVDVQYFNPPTWIQGTWVSKERGVVLDGYKFTSNDFIMTHGHTKLISSYKSKLHNMESEGIFPVVYEKAAKNEYTFTITYGNEHMDFSFYKASNGSLISNKREGAYIKQP
ncbi:hypothetical protein JM658_15685 [Joostella atrarenae]|uniref:Lipoprotein n=1 Tax=Joostella atrarenae TaxID=679257 RepID=A0ABS9J766_9FLAO|nr:hypothetical protein [Joostella atrarenae]MCF8716272.1 hypothetical protein [Joostella atrarenae]